MKTKTALSTKKQIKKNSFDSALIHLGLHIPAQKQILSKVSFCQK